jgi:hypothetical protein
MKAFSRLLVLVAVGPLLAPARDAREEETASS